MGCVADKTNISEIGGGTDKLVEEFLFHLSDAHGITVKTYTDERWQAPKLLKALRVF